LSIPNRRAALASFFGIGTGIAIFFSMHEEKESNSTPIKIKPSRHDEWILAALLAAGLFQAGTAIHQMNRMARSDLHLQIGSDQEGARQPVKPVPVTASDSLVATTAGNRHHS
jgi:hypothetical protein